MASKRQASFELLRIIAMLMVIALHYIIKGYGTAAENHTLVGHAVMLIEAFCIVAVNCYVLISGYFLVESEWKPGRIMSLFVQVLFYSLLVPVAMLSIGMISWKNLGLYDWLDFILPIESEHYWFATSYIMMYIFAPVLAAGAKSMDKKTLRRVIVTMLIFFSIGKTVLPIPFVTDRYGYDFGWFLCLFLIAAYLRMYPPQWLDSVTNCKRLYICMCLAIFLLSDFIGTLGDKQEAFDYYSDMPYTYNHLLCLIGAVGLFSWFKNIHIREGKAAEIIRRLAPYTFGVYLLHEHILIRYEWTKWLRVDKVVGTWLFLPHMLGCILVIFILGILVDYIRLYIFEKIKKAAAILNK